MNPKARNVLTFGFKSATNAFGVCLTRNLRIGIFSALFGLLTISLFRPETTLDETAVLVLVPIAVFLALIKVSVIVSTWIDLPQPSTLPDLRIEFVAWLLAFDVMIIWVGVPSLFAYRALGMEWAMALAIKLIFVLIAILIIALCAGISLATVYPLGMRFFKALPPREPGLSVLNH